MVLELPQNARARAPTRSKTARTSATAAFDHGQLTQRRQEEPVIKSDGDGGEYENDQHANLLVEAMLVFALILRRARKRPSRRMRAASCFETPCPSALKTRVNAL